MVLPNIFGRTIFFLFAYTYDHAGRLSTETTTLNDSAPVVTRYSYNEIGQLTRRNLNGLIEDYTYNTQGWLTGQDSPYYSATLKYYDSTGALKTVDVSKVNYIMYYHEALSIISNFEVARIVDSENFAGSKAQVEMNTGYKVTNNALVYVRKTTAGGGG